ncbi:hypothetical protein H0E87_022962 [Populus deltoides]|uniref:Uncharacterized protein n=1 Tax=Populus deltoides TaxID=3696 RepID=A0A8T2XAR7_POPDE|nr:hypothetical protein H0E87_022962 [Populus deltoides]
MSSRPRLLSTKTAQVKSNPPHVAMVTLLDHSVLEDSDELDDWDMQHLIDHYQEDEVVYLDTISKLSNTLAALASIPSCDVQLLGSKKMILAGYSWRPTESSLGDGFGAGHGMLGQAGSGKPKVAVEKLEIKHCVRRSGSTSSGFTSCLAFSSVLEMELPNPLTHEDKLGYGTEGAFFSDSL